MSVTIYDPGKQVFSNRKWKIKKRRELKDAISAAEKYRIGCMYCPGYQKDIEVFFWALKRMRLSHSQKEWGK